LGAGLLLDWLNDSFADLRRAYVAERAKPVPGWVRTEYRGGVRVLYHRPVRALSLQTCIVYAHGGGWIVGSPETHLDISSALCRQTGLAVYSVDYRLAPEFNAYDQIGDILRVTSALRGRRYILCGDSAGASLVAAAACVAHARLRKQISGIALFYGYFGLVQDAAFRTHVSRADGLDEQTLRRYWNAVNRDLQRSPLHSSQLGELAGVPLFVMAGTDDPLLGSSVRLIHAIIRRGGRVHSEILRKKKHGHLHDQCAELRTKKYVFSALKHWIGMLKD
jgi:acetyl esterase/lipase